MSVHKPVEKKGIYLITFTCFRWLPLIQQTNGYDLIYNFFTIIEDMGHAVLGYVIMTNHVHLLVYFNGVGKLNTLIGNGKRFMAYEIVKRLELNGERDILMELESAVKQKDRPGIKNMKCWLLALI